MSRPNILNLKDVSLDDYRPIEDVFDEKILEEIPVPEPQVIAHDVIPPRFVNLDDWPCSTGLRCWACDCTFDGRPKFVATSVTRAKHAGSPVFGVEGNFCTFNCAARYIDTVYEHTTKHWRLRDNLCLAYRVFTGKKIKHIAAAPKKTEMRAYGGPLSRNEFWKKLRDLDPVHGLRDHRPGSVVPERLRVVGARIWEVGRPEPVAKVGRPEPVPDNAAPLDDLDMDMLLARLSQTTKTGPPPSEDLRTP